MTLAIYCAGGLGKEVLSVAKNANRWDNIIFVDDVTDEKIIQGVSVYKFDMLKSFFGSDLEFIIANGEPYAREKLYNKVKEGDYRLATLYCGGSCILPNTVIMNGCVLYDCKISTEVSIGCNTYINTEVIIGHGTSVGANCVISPRAFIGGKCTIGDRVYVAPGVIIKDRVIIGDDAVLGLGSVVLRNVKPSSIMLGNPARRIGANQEHTVFDRF